MASIFSISNTAVSEKIGKVTANIGFETEGETGASSLYSECEVWQQSGFASIPADPEGEDFCSALTLDGDSGNPIIIATYDKRRGAVVKGLLPGEAALYSLNKKETSTIIRVKHEAITIEYGGKSLLTVKDGKIILTTDKVYIGDENANEPLVTKTDFDRLVEVVNDFITAYSTHINVTTAGSGALSPADGAIVKKIKALKANGTNSIVVKD